MGLTRDYLRYAQCEVFGVIASNKCNVVFLDVRGTRGKYCAVGACEDVIVWDIRTGEKRFTLKGDKQEVTRLARSPDKLHLAVGYNDGTVCVFDLMTGEKSITFSGHKSAVTVLKYDQRGLRLVSGGKDTNVIVWDIVNESGLYRLKGHKGQITQAHFLKQKDLLVTSSKDTFVKFWDLETQHCFKTIVEHRSEVYDFVLIKEDTRLVTGSGDSELRVWNVDYDTQGDTDEPESKKSRLEDQNQLDEGEDDELHILRCTKVGSVMRSGRDRLVSMVTDEQETSIICHGADKMLDIFKLPSAEDLKKKLSKRQKKIRKKLKEEESQEMDSEPKITLEDEISRQTAVKMGGKISCVDVTVESKGLLKVLALFNNNKLGYCSLNLLEKKSEPTSVGHLSMLGHQSDVRTLSFSSDNTALLSGSAESVKIWNRSSLQCIRTMSCDYALCSVFAPGDRHVIIGTKSGKLQIFDIGSGSLLEEIEGHSGAVWSVCMSPDKRGLVSGSADKEVKFWMFELVASQENQSGSQQLTLKHVRTLKLEEDVLGVRFNPDQRLLAVALLDSTIKVFFVDTLKFFLSLYGHKLPVLCLDISSDSKLLVSGSADRNIKIWGLDFGDCHRSIFAHDDSVMCIQFVPQTHLFFTGGKDKKIKQWDADNFEHIMTLEGHHAEVWSMCITSSGNILASASHDKSLRLWEKTEEILNLDEEKEMAREKEYEDSLAHSGEVVVPGETNTETGLAGKKSIETVKAAERIMEALDLYKEEKYKYQQHDLECKQRGRQLPAPEPHPLITAFNAPTPEKYVLLVIKKVRSSELEESLLVLPFSYVIDLLKLLDHFITNGWDVELSCRCLLFLLRVHHGQITSNQMLIPVIDRLRKVTIEKVTNLRDCVGFNLAGLQFLQQEIEQAEETVFFADATDRFKEKKKKQKKKAILAIKT